MGAAFGGGTAGLFADVYGRKPALLFSSLPNMIGWLLLSLAQYCRHPAGFKVLILVGRCFTGIALGWSFVVSPVSYLVHAIQCSRSSVN